MGFLFLTCRRSTPNTPAIYTAFLAQNMADRLSALKWEKNRRPRRQASSPGGEIW